MKDAERKALIRERLEALAKLKEPVHGGKVRKASEPNRRMV